jgi:spectinomycin phosphotransferase
MLEKPDYADNDLIAHATRAFGIRFTAIAFLPLGADVNTSVYRIVCDDGTAYFLKLRRGAFDALSVTLPRYLSEHGIPQVMAPVLTLDGALLTRLDEDTTMVVYPFVEGQNAYEARMSERHWVEFGSAMQRIHTTALPPTLRDTMQQVTYSSHWRDRLSAILHQLATESFADPIANQLAELLLEQHDDVAQVVMRAEQLATVLRNQSPQHVLCHSDVHAGNLLLVPAGGLYIVDWDEPILAPKERDLMFIGAGFGFGGCSALEEEESFYRWYGDAAIDIRALAYFRYERIVQDILAYCDALLYSTEGGADRAQSLHYVWSNFMPNGTIAMARRVDTL